MKPVFISYVHENKLEVDRIHQELESYDIKVWRDLQDLNPGERWKRQIRKAIQDGTFFIACFSKEYHDRYESYMNEELTIAIERLRQLHIDQVWFIPVKLNDCELPDIDIGRGETLEDLTYVKLYKDWDGGIQRIVNLIRSESSENTWDESRIDIEIDQRAVAEYNKGLVCQKEIGLTSHPEEKQQRIQKTLDHYSKALKIQPDYIHALNARGGIHIFMEKYDDAIKDFTETLRLDPAYFVAYCNRGTLYKILGKNKEAIEDFSNAIKLRPNLPYAYFNRGAVFSSIDNFTQAIKDYSMAIEFRSDYVEAYLNRAVAYCEKGVFGLAIEDYTQAIEVNPDDARAYCYRGIIWLNLKNWSKAKSDLTVAQERGIDIITMFNTIHENVSVFEKKNRFKLPEDLAAMLVRQD